MYFLKVLIGIQTSISLLEAHHIDLEKKTTWKFSIADIIKNVMCSLWLDFLCHGWAGWSCTVLWISQKNQNQKTGQGWSSLVQYWIWLPALQQTNKQIVKMYKFVETFVIWDLCNMQRFLSFQIITVFAKTTVAKPLLLYLLIVHSHESKHF